MRETKVNRLCTCENCGNEAEMVVSCSSGADSRAPEAQTTDAPQANGTAVCSRCANEADMWIDL